MLLINTLYALFIVMLTALFYRFVALRAAGANVTA
jgi:hypothetical protein